MANMNDTFDQGSDFSDGWMPPSSFVEEPYIPPPPPQFVPLEQVYQPLANAYRRGGAQDDAVGDMDVTNPEWTAAQEQARDTPPSGAESGYTAMDVNEMFARQAYEAQRRGEREAGTGPALDAETRRRLEAAGVGGGRPSYLPSEWGTAPDLAGRGEGGAIAMRVLNAGNAALNRLTIEADRNIPGQGQGLLAYEFDRLVASGESPDEAAVKVMERYGEAARRLQEDAGASLGSRALAGASRLLGVAQNVTAPAPIPGGTTLPIGLGLIKGLSKGGIQKAVTELGFKDVKEAADALENPEVLRELATKFGQKNVDAFRTAVRDAAEGGDDELTAQLRASLAAAKAGPQALKNAQDIATAGARASQDVDRLAQKIAILQDKGVKVLSQGNDVVTESGSRVWSAQSVREAQEIADAINGGKQVVMPKVATVADEARVADEAIRTADQAGVVTAKTGTGEVVESFSKEAVEAGARAADEATAAGKSADLVRSAEVAAMRNQARTEAFAKTLPSEDTMRLIRGEAQNAGDVARGAPIMKGATPDEVNGLVKAMREGGATDEEIGRFIGQKPPKRVDIDTATGGGGRRVPKDPADAVGLADQQPGRWEKFLDVWNAPKTLKAAFDLSAPLRQGAMLAIGHPTEWAKSWKPMLHALVSEDFARSVNDELLKTDRGRLYIAPLDGRLAAREEMFLSKLVEKLPVIGGGVRASNRAYVTFLNKLRADVYDNAIAGWEKAGKPATDKELRVLQDWVNHATGRGDLPAFIERNKNLSATLSSLYFSPRYVVSRFQAVGDAGQFLKDRDNRAAQMAAADLTKFIAGVAGVTFSLAWLAGGKVEIDPRSSLFGKAQFGDTTLDFAAGENQVVRAVAQALSGQRKVLSGKQEGDVVPESRLNVIWRFNESKLAPTTGLAYGLGAEEMAKGGTSLPGHSAISKRERAEAGDEALDQPLGRDYVGEPFALKDIPGMVAIPLFPQDLLEAIQADRDSGGSGVAGAAMGSLAAFGVGVSTRTSDGGGSSSPQQPAAPGKKRVVPLR